MKIKSSNLWFKLYTLFIGETPASFYGFILWPIVAVLSIAVAMLIFVAFISLSIASLAYSTIWTAFYLSSYPLPLRNADVLYIGYALWFMAGVYFITYYINNLIKHYNLKKWVKYIINAISPKIEIEE